MVRNYNGNVNRNTIRDLKKLCRINGENENILFEAFDEKGVVCVYENLDFFGFPDEMSYTIKLSSEQEIKEYIKKEFLKRLSNYTESHEVTNDYFLDDLLAYIKANYRFPEEHVLAEIEKEAEKKRISELPNNSSQSRDITQFDIAKEILELAEEIMEIRRENNTREIFIPAEPYPESLSISDSVISVDIFHEAYYGTKDFRDYSCNCRIKADCIDFSFEYDFDGQPTFSTEYLFNESIEEKDVIKHLITIHKQISEIAKKEGFKFISEIDYDKFLQHV